MREDLKIEYLSKYILLFQFYSDVGSNHFLDKVRRKSNDSFLRISWGFNFLKIKLRYFLD